MIRQIEGKRSAPTRQRFVRLSYRVGHRGGLLVVVSGLYLLI